MALSDFGTYPALGSEKPAEHDRQKNTEALFDALPASPRVALFADTFHEANGVATLLRQLTRFAQARQLPFLMIRGGERTEFTNHGSLEILQLKRGPATFPLDQSLSFDPMLARHKAVVLDRLRAFQPDLVHMTGPGDFGFLGLWASHAVHVPLVASWHTNLHEYLGRRLHHGLKRTPQQLRAGVARIAEQQGLRGLMRFYRTARFVLAPNQDQVDLLHARTGKPAFLMPHGVDLDQYRPVSRDDADTRPFCIGYVGRLTTEKNIRSFIELERRLLAAGERNFKFLIVGEGNQGKWLARHLQNAELTGVLRGSQLAAAYARMDAFVFPSLTDTFGLVILEAMASGVPVVLSPETGRHVGVEDGISGFLSEDFVPSLQCLMHSPPLRRAMSGAARNFAQTNSWDMVFDGLYQAYVTGLSLLNPKPVRSF